MNKNKKWVVLAVVLLALGILVCVISYAALGFDAKALSSSRFVTNEYTITDAFENISILGDIESITFARAEDGECRVVCYEDEKELHHVRVEADTLTVDKPSSRNWYIGITVEEPKITVYLPDRLYGALFVKADTGAVTVPEPFTFESITIRLDTGDIELSAAAEGVVTLRTDTGKIDLHDMTAQSIVLSSGTGYIRVKDVTCEGILETGTDTGRTDLSRVTCAQLHSTGNTGSLYLTNVIASGEFRIDRDTGSIRFDGCDAPAIYVETNTGDVTGTLLTDKVFLTKTDTGKVDVPKTITGGRCEITTDTGDIKISVS